MRREYRLTRGADFERVRANRRSWSHPLLVCSAARRADDEPTRVGIVVGRRVGKAVTRNQVKRRIREIVRARHSQLPSGYDLVLIARAPAATASLADLAGAFDSLVARARLGNARGPATGHSPDRRAGEPG
jgi:ribonuclease P protein component